MRSDKRSKQELNSDAYLSFIDVFVPSQVEFKTENSAHFSPFRYRDVSLQFSPIDEGVIRKFPIMMRGDGTPWDLGNLYLIGKFTEMAKIEPPKVDTLKFIAKQLIMYLRWIESSQANGSPIHELYFPDQEESRITWTYYRYLRKLVRQNNNEISIGVAKARMQAVVGFYKGLLEWKLVGEGALENVPYKGTLVGMPVVNSIGIKYIKSVETTNFSFRIPRRDRIGVIKDGGNLRPLSEREQEIVLEQLKENKSRVFQLICLVAMYTGARIQTVCTLRVMDIYKLINSNPSNGEMILPVGQGTGVDTKKQKNYRLHFPVALAGMLKDYVECEEYKERCLLSFYGDNSKNYVFLASNGSPYFTSTSEILDRQEGYFSHRISAKDRVSFKIQEGNAVRNFLNRLIRDIRIKYNDFNSFRFHDLRATYGMNFVRDADASGLKDVRTELKARMGHSSFETTQRYLSFDLDNKLVKDVIGYHHERINQVLQEFNV